MLIVLALPHGLILLPIHSAKAALERLSIHPQKSGFRGVSFGAQRQGIHGAAGPDKMHLVYEGLGKYLINMVIDMLQVSCVSVFLPDFCKVPGAYINPPRQNGAKKSFDAGS